LVHLLEAAGIGTNEYSIILNKLPSEAMELLNDDERKLELENLKNDDIVYFYGAYVNTELMETDISRIINDIDEDDRDLRIKIISRKILYGLNGDKRTQLDLKNVRKYSSNSPNNSPIYLSFSSLSKESNTSVPRREEISQMIQKGWHYLYKNFLNPSDLLKDYNVITSNPKLLIYQTIQEAKNAVALVAKKFFAIILQKIHPCLSLLNKYLAYNKNLIGELRLLCPHIVISQFYSSIKELYIPTTIPSQKKKIFTVHVHLIAFMIQKRIASYLKYQFDKFHHEILEDRQNNHEKENKEHDWTNSEF